MLELVGCDLVFDVECVWADDVLVAVVGDAIGIDGLRRLEIGIICGIEIGSSEPVTVMRRTADSFTIVEWMRRVQLRNS